MMKQSSILNDVLGPIMAGPSSSHTAAPGKIGFAIHQLWGKKITSAIVTYDEKGSYPSTHVGQGSDFGFAGGLLGLSTDDEKFRESLSLAQTTGMEIHFAIGALGAHHPNEARIDLLENGKVGMSVLSYSTGGGAFLLAEMDGFPISFDGQCRKYYITCKSNGEKAIQELLTKTGAVFDLHRAEPDRITAASLPAIDAVLFEIHGASLPEGKLPKEIEKEKNILSIRATGPITPLSLRLQPETTYFTAAEAVAWAERHDIRSMAKLALDYECGLGLIDEQAAYVQMKRVLDAMRQAMVPPPADDPVQNLILPQQAHLLESSPYLPLDLGVLNVCLRSAVAVMENGCAHRTVVAAPTAGSSGVLPASIVAVGQALGRTEREVLDALWAAGLVGAFIANQATFGAETAGCQAEIGAAACMAAAGAVQLIGGSIQQGFHAACIAMHSFLGLICDPIGGLVEFPCIERNVTACAVALMSANMSLCGMRSLIPLDETIQAMMQVGLSLPHELRCTCKGGLCATKTGQTLGAFVTQKQAKQLP